MLPSQAVIEWLRQRQTCQIEELVTHLDLTYRVVFKSQQSYYDLRTSSRTLVEEDAIDTSPEGRAASCPKKQEIVELLMRWRTQIATGQVRVLLIDECHLLWGDACGYVWGKTNQRIEVPIANEAATPDLLWRIRPAAASSSMSKPTMLVTRIIQLPF